METRGGSLPETMGSEALARIDPATLATDLADYLVRKGIPFREAHHLTGQAVALAESKAQSLETMSLEAFQSIHPFFNADVFQVFDLQASLAHRNAIGGTAPSAVQAQIDLAKSTLEEVHID